MNAFIAGSSEFAFDTLDFFQPLTDFAGVIFGFMAPLVEAGKGASQLVGMFV